MKLKLDSEYNPFRQKHFAAVGSEVVLLVCANTYKGLVMMMQEPGLSAHTIVMRWVHQYAGELKKRLKKFLKLLSDSCRVNDTHIKIKGVWLYFYRAVDSGGNTLNWMFSVACDQEAAKGFFRQTLSNDHCTPHRIIGIYRNAAYPPDFEVIKNKGPISKWTELRQVKHLNNIIEQGHRFYKRRIRHSQWLQTFRTAEATISGYESMHMICKGQVKGVGRKDALAQKMFVEELSGIAA